MRLGGVNVRQHPDNPQLQQYWVTMETKGDTTRINEDEQELTATMEDADAPPPALFQADMGPLTAVDVSSGMAGSAGAGAPATSAVDENEGKQQGQKRKKDKKTPTKVETPGVDPDEEPKPKRTPQGIHEMAPTTENTQAYINALERDLNERNTLQQKLDGLAFAKASLEKIGPRCTVGVGKAW